VCHNKRKPFFYHSTSLKCNYDKLKLMLGFQIRIRWDPDLFDQIRILQGAMGVTGAIFHVCIPIGIQVENINVLNSRKCSLCFLLLHFTIGSAVKHVLRGRNHKEWLHFCGAAVVTRCGSCHDTDVVFKMKHSIQNHRYFNRTESKKNLVSLFDLTFFGFLILFYYLLW
jgi:hypothetical protein